MTSMGLADNWPGGKTVTVQRRGVTGQDQRGNDQLGVTESFQVQAILEPLMMKLAPRATRGSSFAEELQGEFIVAAGYTMYLPPGTPIDKDDEVVIDGETWRVSGVPGAFTSPFTQAAGPLQIELIRITGLCTFLEGKALAVVPSSMPLLPLANALRCWSTTDHSDRPALTHNPPYRVPPTLAAGGDINPVLIGEFVALGAVSHVLPSRRLSVAHQATPDVLGYSHGLQMGRIDAGRYPAQVIQMQPFRDRPDEVLVSPAVRGWFPELAVSECDIALPIARATKFPGPDPARTELRSVFREWPVLVNARPPSAHPVRVIFNGFWHTPILTGNGIRITG